jgi:hypothetical protein
MRRRTKVFTFNQGSYVEEQIFSPTCAVTAWTGGPALNGINEGKVITMDDVVTPGWRKKLLRGEVVMNPMIRTEKEVFCSGTGWQIDLYNPGSSPCGASIPSVRGDERFWGAVCQRSFNLGVDPDGTVSVDTSPGFSQADLTSAILEASTNCQANVASGNVQGLEDLAQARQAVDLFSIPFSGIRKATASFLSKAKQISSSKKGSGFGKALLEDLSNEWLKYRYGIMPAINDFNAAVKALSERQDDSQQRVTSRASSSISGNRHTSGMFATSGLFCNFDLDIVSHCQVRAMSIDLYRRTVVRDLGLHFDQIPVTLWNLIPFSFVADWFVNAGNYINAVVPRHDVKHITSCYTTETVSDIMYRITNVTQTLGTSFVTKPTGLLHVKWKRKERVPGLPSPSLVVVRDFRFDKLTRMGDALALIGQQLAGYAGLGLK